MSPDLRVVLLKAFAHLGQKSKVEQLTKDVDENSQKLAQAIFLKKQGKTNEAMELLEQVEPDFESILLRAEITWSNGHYDKAHVLFLQGLSDIHLILL